MLPGRDGRTGSEFHGAGQVGNIWIGNSNWFVGGQIQEIARRLRAKMYGSAIHELRGLGTVRAGSLGSEVGQLRQKRQDLKFMTSSGEEDWIGIS